MSWNQLRQDPNQNQGSYQAVMAARRNSPVATAHRSLSSGQQQPNYQQPNLSTATSAMSSLVTDNPATWTAGLPAAKLSTTKLSAAAPAQASSNLSGPWRQ